MDEDGSSRGGNGAAMIEELAPGWGVYVRSEEKLDDVRSPFQRVDVHSTLQFGRLFRIDGRFMTSERDEFLYHEGLVHPMAIAHPAPATALVIGGGDGGSAEELLKHPSITSVTVCELDAAVVEISRRHLASVHRGAFDDPRLRLVIGDGYRFVDATQSRYDLVVLDLTDPGGVSLPLYSLEFFRRCRECLREPGALALHVGSPFAQPQRVRDIVGALRLAFPVVVPWLTSIPLYGGPWLLAIAAVGLDPSAMTAADVDARITERGLRHLGCYNGEVHRGSLAMPNYVRELVGS